METSANRSAVPRPLLKSCEPCRNSKSKCIASENEQSTSCHRCTKLNKQCTFNYAQPRPKRGKQAKSSGRVAIVEKKVDDIHAILQSLKQTDASTAVAASALSPPATEENSPHEHPSSLVKLSERLEPKTLPPCFEQYHHPDVFEKGILTIDEGNELLAKYKQMEPHFPFLQVHQISNVIEMRERNPFLMLAILVTPTRELRGLHRTLDQELREQFAQRVFVEGEKSLDLLQGLIVYLAWYHIHFHPQRQQMYSFSALATAQAVDLGLHHSIQRTDYEKSLAPCDPDGPTPPLGRVMLEEKRISIACYLQASSTALHLRRPVVFRYNDYLEACCIQLSQHSSLPSEAHLIHQVRLQRISEEANDAFGYTMATGLPMGVEMLLHTVKSFQARLQAIHKTFPPDAANMYSLMLAYHGATVYVHEVSLHVDPAVSRVPHSVSVSAVPDPAAVLTPLLLTTLDCTRKLIGYFLSIPRAVLPLLTITDMMRITYAIIVLGKLTLNPTLAAALASQGADIGLPAYIGACIEHIGELIREEGGVQVRDCFWHFNRMLRNTKGWYEAKLERRWEGEGVVGRDGAVRDGKRDRRDDPVDMDPMQVVGQFDYHLHGMEGTGKGDRGSGGEEGANGANGGVAGAQGGMGMEFLSWPPDDGFWEEMLASWPVGMDGVVSV